MIFASDWAQSFSGGRFGAYRHHFIFFSTTTEAYFFDFFEYIRCLISELNRKKPETHRKITEISPVAHRYR